MTDKEYKDWGDNFQTPEKICQYMASMLPENAGTILEPTPGKGNLVRELEKRGEVTAPEDFNKMDAGRRTWLLEDMSWTQLT